MADTIKNHLTITGTEEQINKFLKTTDELFDLDKLLPSPENADATWCLGVWGCKWNVFDCIVEEVTKNSVEYYFNTPWNSPRHGIETISLDYSELHFELEYINRGSFFGNFYVKNGKIFENYCLGFSTALNEKNIEEVLKNKIVRKSKFLTEEIINLKGE